MLSTILPIDGRKGVRVKLKMRDKKIIGELRGAKARTAPKTKKVWKKKRL
jgi:hypothetical protein